MPCIIFLIYFTFNVILKVVQKIFYFTISTILSKFPTAFNCKKNLTTNEDNRKVWGSWKTITGIFVPYEQFTLKLFACRDFPRNSGLQRFSQFLNKPSQTRKMESNYNLNHKIFHRNYDKNL